MSAPVTPTVTKESFDEFVRAQGDKAIDHSHGIHSAFENCALGQYYVHLTGIKILSPQIAFEFYESVRRAIDNEGVAVGIIYAKHASYSELLKELTGDPQ